MSIASILSDLWRGGGGLLKPPPPPRAQELQKSPGRIGLNKYVLTLSLIFKCVALADMDRQLVPESPVSKLLTIENSIYVHKENNENDDNNCLLTITTKITKTRVETTARATVPLAATTTALTTMAISTATTC